MHAIASVHVYPFLILNVGKKPKAKVLVSMALEFVHQYLRSHIQHVRARSSCTREGGNLFHFGKDRLCRRTKCCQLFRCVSSYYYPKCVSHRCPWCGCLNDLFSISCMHAYGRTPTMEAWNYHHTRNVVEPNTIINECINQLYLLLRASIIAGCKQAKC